MTYPKTRRELELLKAIKKGNIATVKELLNSNNFTELSDKRYFDYQLIIEALGRSLIQLAKLLITEGFRVYQECQVETILEYAVCLEDTELVTTLLVKGASPDILVPNNQNLTPFHLAINRNLSSIIDLFLSQLDVETYDKSNLLHYVIKQNKIAVAIQMIEKGLSLRTKNERDLTPFCVALINKNYKILDYLLSHHTVENIDFNNYDDIAPAYIASISGNLQAIEKFVKSGLPINAPLKSSTDIWSSLRDCSGLTLLQCAVKFTRLKVVEFLISIGADICFQNKNGSSALHIAFEAKERGIWPTWQDFEDNNLIIDVILKANIKLKSNPVNKHGLSHFHISCSIDDPTIVEHFLKLGAVIHQPVNSQCHLYKGFSTLHFAAKFRCKKTLELLLKNGADVRQTDYERMTALHVAAKESCVDGVRLLLQYGSDIAAIDSRGNSPVHLAYEKQNYAIIDLLLSVHNVADSNPVNIKGLSHFHIACSRNNVDVVKRFIENGVSLDICISAQSDKVKHYYTPDQSGYSALHIAVSHNKARIVELLLRSGANVGIKDSKGFTPLHVACHYTNEMFHEFIRNILNHFVLNGKLIQQIKPLTDVTKVHKDCSLQFDSHIGKINWLPNRKDYFKIINSLLNYGSDVNCTDNRGNTPILYAYAAISNIEHIFENNLNCSTAFWTRVTDSLSKEVYERRKLMLNNLLKLHINLDECYKNGSILNYFFILLDKEADEMIELFLKNGANPNVTNDMMWTPLQQATFRFNKKCISVLLDYNAKIDGLYPESTATPLLIATSKSVHWMNCIDITKLLIEKGANINAKQSDGRTALHNVVSRCSVYNYSTATAGVISLLIKAGANINGQDVKGLTPLHVACLKGNHYIVNLLLKNGADITIEDNKGRSVPCYLYKKYVKKSSDYFNYVMHILIISLQTRVTSMQVIGLPVSQKVLSSQVKCTDYLSRKYLTIDETALSNKCKIEIKKLQDRKINGNCTLYNVIFKDENALSKLVKNRTFKSVVQAKSFQQKYPIYGYLIQLKYQVGLDRANLLPTAKCALNSLAGHPLPDVCSEHICSYFTNVELKESIETLSSFFDCNAESTDDKMQLKTRRMNKRQKVN